MKTSAGKGKILVVDDDRAVREATRRMLANGGYGVAAGKPGEATGLCETEGPFDLLLTDVVMPEIEGALLAARLRAIQPGLKVLYMSGYGGTQILAAENFSTISKPFSPDFLLLSVGRVIESGGGHGEP